jgi:hypothetical protein
MDLRIFKTLCGAALFLLPTLSLESQTVLEPLLRDPNSIEWSALSRFSGTLTRQEFERRLIEVFDPFHGLDAYLQITNNSVRVIERSSRQRLGIYRFYLHVPFVEGRKVDKRDF